MKSTLLAALVFFLSFSLFAESGDDCPEGLWSAPSEICGCYVFEIGSAADNPQVSWYFNDDGPYLEGHIADYCWEENGTYTVTAVYSSETCLQETYTMEVAVDCFGNDCELDVEYEQNDCGQGVYEVVGAPETGGTWWVINGDWLAESSDVLEVNLEPGEYTICAFYETPDCPMGSEWCVEFFIDDCDQCTEVISFIDASADGPEWVEWTINEIYSQESVEDGVCQDDFWDCQFSTTCLPDGCYEFIVQSETVINAGINFEAFIYSLSEEFELISEIFSDYSVVWEFAIGDGCADPCPQEIWMSEGNNCGCYEFEIGSFIEGEAVAWDFGDGTTIEGGHYIEYCYEEDGEYIVTAWYESSVCEGMLYTLGEANVECQACEIEVEFDQNDCGPGVYEAFGYPENAQLFWYVDTDNEAFATGVSTIEVDFGEPGAHWICVGYETPECPQWVSWCTEFVVDDCNEPCDLDVEIVVAECDWIYLEASSFPAGTMLWWEVDGSMVQEGGDGFDWGFETEGWHEVCVFYETPDCPQGIWACEEIYVVFCTDCPTDIWAGELDDCGCFEFEIGSFQEGESVDWTWGDGTEDIEAGHYIQHCYEEPGLYIVEVNFVSDICPDGVIAVYTIEVVCDDCSDVSFAFDSFADLGGSEYSEWVVTNPDGEAIEEGSCEYVNGPYCDANLCLEDGCYEMDIWFPTPITSDDAFFSAAFIAGEQLPYAGQIIWIDDMHMTYFFGVNSDCGNAIEDVIQSQFEIYPVPASDVLTLNVSHDLVGARVIIYDAQGRSVIDAPMTGINKELSVNSLAQGLYTTVIQNDTVRIARKIQILR